MILTKRYCSLVITEAANGESIMFRYFILLSFCLLNVYASETKINPQTSETSRAVTVAFEPGELTLKDLLEACPAIANGKPSKRVNLNTVGTIITCKGNKYEIRVESFEDTANKLSKETTFKDYINQNNLLDMPSNTMRPLPGIIFESFDFRRAKLNDGVYFTIALRKIES